MGVKAALDPKGSINSGAFRPIRVTVPEGTMLNAKAPAPAGGMAEVGQAAVYTMVAVSLLHPEQTLAEEGAGANHQNLSGQDLRAADPHAFIYYDYPSGGSGASAQRDGLDFVRSIRSGNVNAQSIEVLEHLFPLMFHRHELCQDSGGPGRFRGGMGVVRAYEMPSAGAFSVLTDHALVPAAGLNGGESGAPTRWEVVRGDATQPVSPAFGSKVTAFPLEADDVIRIATQGGGGYGDPLEREPDRVRDDVLDGKISLAQAHAIYGVVLDVETLQLDITATSERRVMLVAQRLRLAPQRGGPPVFEHGMRVAWFHADVATRGIRAGMVVEVIASSHPAPLRVYVSLAHDVAPQTIRLDQEIWERLGLSAAEPLAVRPLGQATASS